MNEDINQAARTVAALVVEKPAPFTVPIRELIPQGAKRMNRKHRSGGPRHPSTETVPVILREMARYDSTVTRTDLHVHVRGKIPDFTGAALTNRLLVMRANGLAISPTRGWWALTEKGREAAKTAVLPELKWLSGGKAKISLRVNGVNKGGPAAAEDSLSNTLSRAIGQLEDLVATLRDVRTIAIKEATRNAKLDKLVKELMAV